MTSPKRSTNLLLVFMLLLTLVTAGASVITNSGGWYRLTDRFSMAMRHVNRRLHFAMGWPLPGTPDLGALETRLSEKGLKRGSPVFMRIFKSELELELWIKQGDVFAHFATYPICYWSGRLGPKMRQGDHQSPEGFYAVAKSQLNPNSRWFRSFNTGFPNPYDREHGRTGSFLMVHGGCSSVGCYAMTNPVMAEIWSLVTAALDGGQSSFGVHIFPFRPTEARLRAYADHVSAPFWRELQPGYDLFEATRIPPQIRVCQKRYVVQPGAQGTQSGATVQTGCAPGPAQQTFLQKAPAAIN